jgi:hypothetical protein
MSRGLHGWATLIHAELREFPSLAKEGWPRHQQNGPVPSRPGCFVQIQKEFFLEVDQHHPVCEGTGPFLDGADTPPRLRRGIRTPQVLHQVNNVIATQKGQSPGGGL